MNDPDAEGMRSGLGPSTEPSPERQAPERPSSLDREGMQSPSTISIRDVEGTPDAPSADAPGSVHDTVISSRAVFLPKTHPLADPHTTQPSMPAYGEPPPTSFDWQRLWRMEDRFDRQDARIRLLEKKLLHVERALKVAVCLVLLVMLAFVILMRTHPAP